MSGSIPAWTRDLKQAFEDRAIPLAPAADVKAVLADRGVRTGLAVGQLKQNRTDSLAWRALLAITPGIGNTAVDYVYNSSVDGSFAERLLSLRDDGFPNLRNAAKVIAAIDEMLELVNAAEQEPDTPETGWAEWLVNRIGETRFGDEALALFRAVGEQLGQDELTKLINEFEPTLKELSSSALDGVRIMTMGMSKGLTLDTAIIIGVDTANVPSPRGDESEELRLLYVALTRATGMTIVSYANRRRGATARVGLPNVWDQREQSPFMAALSDAHCEDGDTFVRTLPDRDEA